MLVLSWRCERAGNKRGKPALYPHNREFCAHQMQRPKTREKKEEILQDPKNWQKERCVSQFLVVDKKEKKIKLCL